LQCFLLVEVYQGTIHSYTLASHPAWKEGKKEHV